MPVALSEGVQTAPMSLNVVTSKEPRSAQRPVVAPRPARGSAGRTPTARPSLPAAHGDTDLLVRYGRGVAGEKDLVATVYALSSGK